MFREPYIWNIKPSLFYIIFVKFIFNIFLYMLTNIDNVMKFFRFFQFNFLPLSILKSPFIGVINYDWTPFYPFEKFIMLNNIPIFKIGNSDKKILYIHGGGFISGDYMTFRSFCLEIYKKIISTGNNIEIWFPNYTLCSEDNYKINKAIEEINYIHSMHEFSCVLADSAGCYLSLQIISPKKLILISPVTDLSCSSKKYDEDDINFNPYLVKKIFKKINHHNPNHNPNPNHPNNIIFVSKNELFVDDSFRIKSSKINIYNSSIHSLPLFYKFNNLANKCLNDIVIEIINSI